MERRYKETIEAIKKLLKGEKAEFYTGSNAEQYVISIDSSGNGEFYYLAGTSRVERGEIKNWEFPEKLRGAMYYEEEKLKQIVEAKMHIEKELQEGNEEEEEVYRKLELFFENRDRNFEATRRRIAGDWVAN